MVKALALGLPTSPRDAELLVPDFVHEGQFYRLPSGSCVVVTGVKEAYVTCAYLPGANGLVVLSRDFFIAKATRVIEGDAPNSSETVSGYRS